jgi:UDP-N-acetylglucosamine--dolichyl-phosphate N-acetylglucosaminephosphotransferase
MLNTFMGLSFNIVYVLAGLTTIQLLTIMGVVDDLVGVPQWLKAFSPLLIAAPLVAVKAAGSTVLAIPFVGHVDFGVFYTFILLPVGIAVASNLTNMLAGFNGIEAGMGSAIFACMIFIAAVHGNPEMLVLFVPMLGALLGFLPKNWYPAKVFPGDVGTLPVGAVLATGVIIGNMESAGALILSLFVLDFFIKLKNRFPSKNWWGEIKDGKLHPLGGKVRSLCQLVMKLANGIEEQKLVLLMVGAQLLVGIGVILLFVRI